MPYKVEFRREAVDDLRHLDKAVAQRILRRLRWLSDNFDTVNAGSAHRRIEGAIQVQSRQLQGNL